MSTSSFNPSTFRQSLLNSGMTEQQADVLAGYSKLQSDVLEDFGKELAQYNAALALKADRFATLASREDLGAVRHAVDEIRIVNGKEHSALREVLRDGITGLRCENNKDHSAQRDALRTEIAELRKYICNENERLNKNILEIHKKLDNNYWEIRKKMDNNYWEIRGILNEIIFKTTSQSTSHMFILMIGIIITVFIVIIK